MSSNFLKKFRIIISVILALILSHFGISYLIILLALGFIIAILNRSKLDALLSGVLYVIVGYIITYPTGLFLVNYIPTTDIPVDTSVITMYTNLMIGILIPSIVALILCGLAAIIGLSIVNIFHRNKHSKTKNKHKYFNDNISKNIKQRKYMK